MKNDELLITLESLVNEIRKEINALDAMILLFNAIGCWRQQLSESGMMHGIVTNGGAAPNRIPKKAPCFFYLRAASEEWIEKLEKRFRKIIHGAELMTDTVAEINPFSLPYKSRNPNRSLELFVMGILRFYLYFNNCRLSGSSRSEKTWRKWISTEANRKVIEY